MSINKAIPPELCYFQKVLEENRDASSQTTGHMVVNDSQIGCVEHISKQNSVLGLILYVLYMDNLTTLIPVFGVC